MQLQIAGWTWGVSKVHSANDLLNVSDCVDLIDAPPTHKMEDEINDNLLINQIQI